MDSLAATKDDEIGSREKGRILLRRRGGFLSGGVFLVGSVGGDYTGGVEEGLVAVTARARGNYPLAGGGGPPGSAYTAVRSYAPGKYYAA